MADRSSAHKTIDYTNIQNVPDFAGQISSLEAKQTFTMEYLITAKGTFYLSRAGKHGRVRITNAYADLGDNSDREQTIQLFVGNTPISIPLTFTPTMKAGKKQLITIEEGKDKVGFWNDVKVWANTDRPVEVKLLCESYEGE